MNCSQLTTQALGRMPELLLKELAKKIASITAQKSSSQALKSVAKKIPVAGLLIGGYMGGKRLIRGEFGIAAMEIGSGALACVPGEAKFKKIFRGGGVLTTLQSIPNSTNFRQERFRR